MRLLKKCSLLFLSLFFSVQLHAFSVTGSESYAKDMNNLPSFKRIYLSAGSMDVTIHPGSKSAVRLEGDKDAVDDLVVKVSQGELNITYKDKTQKKHKKAKIKVDIHTRSLNRIAARGDVDIKGDATLRTSALNFLLSGTGEVDMSVNAKNLLIQISGSTVLTLEGSANYQNVAVTGSGKYDGLDLKSNYADVVLSGDGSAEVNVKNTLDVTLFGSGNVSYKGSPKVTTDISGSGGVVKKSVL